MIEDKPATGEKAVKPARKSSNQLSKVLLHQNTARSCHLSVLRMSQTEELATKRVFGVITLLIADDYLIFLQV